MSYEVRTKTCPFIIHNSSFLLYALFLALTLLLVGCGPGPAPTPTPGPAPPLTPESRWLPGAHARSLPAPAKLVTPGRLTVGSDAGNPPMEYIDSRGKPVGMDVDIAEELASRMGLEAKIINFKLDDILLALDGGQFDVVISALTITDERKKLADFAPYLDEGLAVMVRKGDAKGIKSLEDLSGKRVAVREGSEGERTLMQLNETLVGSGKPKVDVQTYPTDSEVVDQLPIAKVDATLHDSPSAQYYVKLNPASFELAFPVFDVSSLGIAVARTNKPMLEAINAALSAMRTDGTFNAIEDKWGITR